MAERIRLLLVTVWAGSLWTIGYLVAPTLFATLSDRVLAGTIAGRLFLLEAWLSLFCGVALLLNLRLAAKRQGESMQRPVLWLVLGMLACTLVGYFALHPYMASLREAMDSGLGGEAARSRFGLLHGISSMFYLAQSLLAMALVLKLR